MRTHRIQAQNTLDRDARLRLYHSIHIISLFSFLMLIFYTAEPFLHRAVKTFLSYAFAKDTVLMQTIERIYAMFAYACTFFVPLFITLLIFSKNGISRRAANPNISFSMKLPPRPLASIFAVIGILYVIGDITGAIFAFLGKIGLPIAVAERTLPDTPPDMLLYFISSVILPAIVEELIFRGYILHLLLPHGRTFAILVSGVLFGVMHFYLPQLLYATVAGILIGYLVVQSGSVWCGIFLHIINNLLVYVSDMASVLLDAPSYAFFSIVLKGIIYLCAMVGLILVFANGFGSYKKSFDDFTEHSTTYTSTLSTEIAVRYALIPPLIVYLLCAFIQTAYNSFIFL